MSRLYSVDHTYFNEIDTEDKAYFLGLLAADGNVMTGGNRISIHLSGERDAKLVHLFKKHTKSESPIKKVQPKYPGSLPQYGINIYSCEMKKSLGRHGVFPCKSTIYQFNSKIPQYLLRHYIRGYFDGDGTVSFTKSGNWSCGIVSSHIFIEAIKEFINGQLHLNGYIAQKTDNCSQIKLSSTFKCFIFLDWLYNNSTLYLDRKYEKYLQCREFVRNLLTSGDLSNSTDNRINNIKKCCDLLKIDISNNLTIPASFMSQQFFADVKDMYQDGMTSRQIATKISKSKTFIIKILKLQGVTIRPNNRRI